MARNLSVATSESRVDNQPQTPRAGVQPHVSNAQSDRFLAMMRNLLIMAGAAGAGAGIVSLTPITAEAQAAMPTLSGKINNGVFEGVSGTVPVSMSFKGKIDPGTLAELNGQDVKITFEGTQDASGIFTGRLVITGKTNKGVAYTGTMPHCGRLAFTLQPQACTKPECGGGKGKGVIPPTPKPVQVEPLDLGIPGNFSGKCRADEAADHTGVGGQLDFRLLQSPIGPIAEYGVEPGEGQFGWEITRLDNSEPGVDDRKVVVRLVKGSPGEAGYAVYVSAPILPDTVAVEGKLEKCRFTLEESTPPFNTDPSAPAELKLKFKLSGDARTGVIIENPTLDNGSPIPAGVSCAADVASSFNAAIRVICTSERGAAFGGQLPAGALGRQLKASLPRLDRPSR